MTTPFCMERIIKKINGEEVTKMALVAPFINLLG